MVNLLEVKENLERLLLEINKVSNPETVKIATYVDEGGYCDFARLVSSLNLEFSFEEEDNVVVLGYELEYSDDEES